MKLLSLLGLFSAIAFEMVLAEPNQVERQIIKYYNRPNPPTVIRLWPEASPRNQSRNRIPEAAQLTDKLRVTNTASPSMLVCPPPTEVPNSGIMMLFCPGGGYAKLAMPNPKEFTEWMNHLGVTVATLKYHVPRHSDDPNHLWPLADAQRAMRLLRSRAQEFNIDPDKIGIVGSSAGGHLAMNTCVNYAHPAYEELDEADKLSCRPAFGLLYYPAYLAKNKQTLEIDPSWNAKRINSQTPPIFMTINGDDGFITSSLRAVIELKKAKVPTELHVWQKGGHGGFNKYPLLEHTRPGIRFLVRHKMLPETLIEKSDQWLDDKIATDYSTSVTKPKTQQAVTPTLQGSTELSNIDADIAKQTQQERLVLPLWPDDGRRSDDPLKSEQETVEIKGIARGSQVTKPTLTYFPAKEPTDKTIIVFPGGAYNILAYQHEGIDVCNWLNQNNINTFLLKYRTPRRQGLAKHAVALQDAHRAIRLVRSQAKQLGIHPDKIGILGFSAGGHLCALATTDRKEQSYAPIDEHDQVSPIANFGVLIYPAYTTMDKKPETVDPNLISPKPSKVPLFVATAFDDKWTDGQLYFLHERFQQKQSIEYHIYENGGHGMGLKPDAPQSFGQWSRECLRWLDTIK